jgi:uncharacterized membrane protein
MTRIRLAAALAAAAALPAQAALDGSKSLICATLEVFHCEAASKCTGETTQSIDAPEFWSVSLPEKRITATRPSGESVNADIELARETDERVFMQGVTAKIGWTFNINRADGKMTLVAADDSGGYIVTGACTTR